MFHYAIVLLAIVGSASVQVFSSAQTTGEHFQAKRVNGNLLCAMDSADVASPVRSRIECSTQCEEDDKCLSINYKDDNKQSPVCELFYWFMKQNFAVSPHCAHYQHVERTMANQVDFICTTDGIAQSGVYNVTSGGQSFHVYCDMDTDGGGWLVFQRRQDGSVDFYRNWYNYTNGFGDLTGEFWLGNEFLYLLTSSSVRQYELRIDMADFENVRRYAKYSNFVVGSRITHCSMTFAGFTAGDAGDSFSAHNGMMFSTYDSDHDVAGSNCAAEYKGAYWYSNSHVSNLNGLYLRGNHTQYAAGIEWFSWHGYYYSLRWVEMKIRPVV